jgi:hypothetical protein
VPEVERRSGAGNSAPAAELGAVATTPDFLSLERHRDLVGRERRPYARWILLGLLGLILLLGLLNVFGQRPQTSSASSDVATLEVYSPERVRGGLYFESRFRIAARREIENATLVLDPGWLEGMTLNTLAPSPIGEASRDGRLALELGRIPAGGTHLFFLQFQVNPTNVGTRAQDVELYDGETRLLRLDRTITVWP